MFTDDQGQPIEPSNVAGATVQLPYDRVFAFHVDDTLKAAIEDLMKNCGNGQGALALTAHVDSSGQVVLGALAGERINDYIKVAGFAQWSPGQGAEAGGEVKISWAP